MCKETRIIIAGSRNFSDYKILKQSLDDYIKDTTNVIIISGTAKGADMIGEKYAAEQGFSCKKFPADWNTYGKRAGYIRNEEMAKFSIEYENKGVLFAFWDGISKGTEHMINLAEKHGLEVHIILF